MFTPLGKGCDSSEDRTQLRAEQLAAQEHSRKEADTFTAPTHEGEQQGQDTEAVHTHR